ncbi:MAG TPA: hypothetical protein PKN32_00330 [Bacteroidales bacterium]|nr:hypothetical protein [Bacteroidales bacterium]
MKEKINIKNYEAWWVDYLDGKLSQSDEEKLFDFLELNPEISTTLIDSDDYKLPDLDVKYPNKSILKAENNIDYLLIAKVENQINQEDNLFISEKINTKPEVANDYKLYQKAVATPDRNIVFKGKKYLKKKEAIPLYKYVSIAAVFAAVFTIGYLLTNNVQNFDEGEAPQISFFSIPFNHNIDTVNRKDEILFRQSDNYNNTLFVANSTEKEQELNNEILSKIDVPEKLPLNQICKLKNHEMSNDKQLLAYQVSKMPEENVAFEYELQYIKSPKENKFKSTISKVYDFGKEIDLAGSFDRLKMAKEDLFITMNE